MQTTFADPLHPEPKEPMSKYVVLRYDENFNLIMEQIDDLKVAKAIISAHSGVIIKTAEL